MGHQYKCIYENGDPQQIHNTEYANKYSQNKTVNSLGKQFTVDWFMSHQKIEDSEWTDIRRFNWKFHLLQMK